MPVRDVTVTAPGGELGCDGTADVVGVVRTDGRPGTLSGRPAGDPQLRQERLARAEVRPGAVPGQDDERADRELGPYTVQGRPDRAAREQRDRVPRARVMPDDQQGADLVGNVVEDIEGSCSSAPYSRGSRRGATGRSGSAAASSHVSRARRLRWALARCSIRRPDEIAYYLVCAPLCSRTPSWRPRHTSPGKGGGTGETAETIELTVAEIQRLLAACRPQPAHLRGHRGRRHAVSWSNWRRRRQAVARRCHYQRRCRTIEGRSLRDRP
ncbi:hypothetical protein GGE06_008093 [Streptomyces sp. SFB5A]|uniref:Uncharacterized protein n=1 Tax=Streptomyces nymphaeiformis TaxID=2663842 RepID=A0A7W7XH29_9ACTN|nr:hypothetical protein [Streptomyces nymphaeiformis]